MATRYIEGYVKTVIESEVAAKEQPLEEFFRMSYTDEADKEAKVALCEQIAKDNGYTSYRIENHIHQHREGKPCKVEIIKEV